jgi:hypothetical protein
MFAIDFAKELDREMKKKLGTDEESTIIMVCQANLLWATPGGIVEYLEDKCTYEADD